MITIFTKASCPACDEARAALRSAGIAFEEVDVKSDASLISEYGNFVPVVEVDGTAIFHAGMDVETLPDLVSEMVS